MSLSNAQSISRYALVEFFWVLTGCITQSVFPELDWFLLAVTFLPIAIRLIWNHSSFESSTLNYLLPLFLITSFVGLLVSYNQDKAVHKFVLIVISILLFYSLTYQTQENLWIIAIGLGIFGVLTTIIFVLTNNWSTFPADFQFIEDFGKWWIKIGGSVEVDSFINAKMFHANIIAGINAILIPLCGVTSFHFWKSENKIFTSISISILIFLSFGLLITSSRAAWVATLIGLLIFTAINNLIIKEFLKKNRYIFLLIPLLIITIGVFAPAFITSTINHSTPSLSEVTSLESRLQLTKQTYFLIADFPFTGGGLGSFPGLYSQYILAIPFFMFGYSHNLYLDLTLEQGILGLILWVIITILCSSILGIVVLKKQIKNDQTLFSSAIFSGFLIFLIHGIIDDPIYSSSWGLPLIFLFPGLTIALSKTEAKIQQQSKFDILPISVIITILAISTFIFSKQILASGYANIGAINMAKIELADWPTNEWNEQRDLAIFSQAKKHLEKSLAHQEKNFSANYRLGLIWMAQHNFERALPYLETAINASPEHRGIQKNLGYTYTWLGRVHQAEQILDNFPEAQTEMKVYVGWWQTQGRDDLSKYAMKMSILLDNGVNHP